MTAALVYFVNIDAVPPKSSTDMSDSSVNTFATACDNTQRSARVHDYVYIFAYDVSSLYDTFDLTAALVPIITRRSHGSNYFSPSSISSHFGC